MDFNFYTYILASSKNGTLYIGVTRNLSKRVFQHKQGKASLFTKKYACVMLVYYEGFLSAYDAICREKVLKKLYRFEKIDLIESVNPNWQDLYVHVAAAS